nr:hypothetical protein [Tanacetum cinerariifolium]
AITAAIRAMTLGARGSTLGEGKFIDEIGELRAISGHVLGAAGVQIPKNNFDNISKIIGTIITVLCFLKLFPLAPDVYVLEVPVAKETDMVIHSAKTEMMSLVVEIKCVDMNVAEFDKVAGSSDGLQPEQLDLSCVHALNEPHLNEIRVILSEHEADQHSLCANPLPV